MKRYGLVRGTNGYPWWIGECEDGEYVSYGDYSALLDASAWRPVSEPPEMEDRNGMGDLESVCVQTFLPDGSQIVGWASRDSEDGWVYWTQAGSFSGSLTPTHWRPLPEGPK